MKNSLLVLFGNPDALPRLEGMERDWEVGRAASVQEALHMLAQRPHDALLSDLQPTNGHAAFYQTVASRYPKIVRVHAYHPGSPSNRFLSNGIVHQYIPAACHQDVLVAAIQRGRLLNTWLNDPNIHRLFAKLDQLPSVPSVYLRLIEKLQSPDTTTEELGSIIAQDPVATAKILQLVNSAFFGLGHNIVSPGEAVSYLGFERVRALILLVHTFSNYQTHPGMPVKSEALSRHSMMTASLARVIAREEARDNQTAEKSFTGGILHDLGKLMLAINQPEGYTTALHLAHTQNRPVQDAETEVFGGSHAEIGACVLGIWGLPPEIVEAIAYHHNPINHFWDAFGPVTAVHAADCLLHELHPDPDAAAPPALDMAYLEHLGLEDRVEAWRDLCRDALTQLEG